jgi:hypothetical protein
MKSITILRYNVDEGKFEEVILFVFFLEKKIIFFLFRLLMMFNHNGQQHVNFLMMIHLYVQKMEEI